MNHAAGMARRTYEEIVRECGLTDDEVRVLSLARRGLSYIQMAQECHCSDSTIKRRLQSIRRKIKAYPN